MTDEEDMDWIDIQMAKVELGKIVAEAIQNGDLEVTSNTKEKTRKQCRDCGKLFDTYEYDQMACENCREPVIDKK